MTQLPWNLGVPRYGDAGCLSEWIQTQLNRCDDDEFAWNFAAACPVPGVQADKYRHRLLTVGGETLLAGIRFKGCDVSQPFVDLMAWTGEPEACWVSAIAQEFAAFGPRSVRFAWSSATAPPWPGEVDQYVYAGRVSGPYVGDERVRGAVDVSWYDEFRRQFEIWRGNSPLGGEVSPAELTSLQGCLDHGRVVVVTENGRFLGVAACRPQRERAFGGWAVVEEFVAPEVQGQGLGAALQTGLLQRLPDGDVLWGTIHGRNVASQATARRCGREVVESWWLASIGK